jgi:alpha-beta hydrolase superfamily lysophospholipase
MIAEVREGRAMGGEATELFWRLWGAPDSRATVLLVHGLGEHSGRYRPLAESLTSVGISVFAFDLRGHGRSRGPRGDVSAFPRFLEDLLVMEDVLAGEMPGRDPRFLLGHSLGGLIGIQRLKTLADGYDGAVFSAPWLRVAQPPWLRALGRGLGWLFPRVAVRAGPGPHRLTRDPEMAEAWRKDPLIHTRVTGGLFREAERVQCSLLSEGLKPGIPMLFLVPDDDPVVDTTTTLSFARGNVAEGTRIEILEGRRHEPFNDLGREEVFRFVAEWLTSLMGDASAPRIQETDEEH